MSWEAIGGIDSLLEAVSILLTPLYFAKHRKDNASLFIVCVFQTAIDG